MRDASIEHLGLADKPLFNFDDVSPILYWIRYRICFERKSWVPQTALWTGGKKIVQGSCNFEKKDADSLFFFKTAEDFCLFILLTFFFYITADRFARIINIDGGKLMVDRQMDN